jgi:hypothetical protein
MDKYSDLIDTVACAVFGAGSIMGTAWLILSLGKSWAPV